MSRKLVIILCLFLVGLLSADAFAGGNVKAKSKPKWYLKYKANAWTGCYGPVPYYLCYHHSSGYGGADANCAKAYCLFGWAKSHAWINSSGYGIVPERKGWGFAGKDGIDSTSHSEGNISGNIEFDTLGLTITVTIDSGTQLGASWDSSFALLTITAYINPDTADIPITPENTFWSGSIKIANGDASASGELTLDDMIYEPITGNLLVTDTKVITIPFPLTRGEFDDVEVEIYADAGYGEGIPAAAIPTLTEWGMIIFGVLLFGWMAWVIIRRRRRVTIGI
jgi:hypothetical protein